LLQVLRAYDTRFGYSEARPDLYEEPELAPGTELVCRIGDRDVGAIATSVPGGAHTTETATNTISQAAPRDDGAGHRLDLKLRDRRRKVYDEDLRIEWMWEFAGEIVVLATPFHEGRHYATSPKDFVPVIRFLQRMHQLGCVHGDIRCANIVFGKGAGLLIDLDMGGRISDSPRYPDGYKGPLPDGCRLGLQGKVITPRHDWFAMLKVVFSLHFIQPPPELPMTTARYMEQDKFTRYCYGTTLEDADAMADELVEYLESAEASGYRITYSHELAEIVAKNWSRK
jgi:hypothetical protein